MTVAPHRYGVKRDVDGGILNGLVTRVTGFLSAHLCHEFTLKFRGKVAADHELGVVALKAVAGDHSRICKSNNVLRQSYVFYNL